jgi:hypothetical protein
LGQGVTDLGAQAMLRRGLVPPGGERLLERPVSGDADAFQLLSAELLHVTLLSKDVLVVSSADGMTLKAASTTARSQRLLTDCLYELDVDARLIPVD